jgi:Proteasome subunit
VTVGIGAICEDGKTAVVAADKMVTFSSPMNLQTEPPTLKKITELTDRVLLVFSGSTADGEEIISATRPLLTDEIKSSYNVYEAKRASEVAPGVGKLTDMAVIKNGKIHFGGTELLSVLEESHKEKPALNPDELEKLQKVCNDSTK